MKRAAFDALNEKSLGDISADQLLDAVELGHIDSRLLAVWPEKKKVELEIDPPAFKKVKLKDLLGRLQNEKKKYELEVERVIDQPVIIRDFKTEKKKVELEIDPPGVGGVGGGGPILTNEKKKREIEVGLAAGSRLSVDTLIDALEERLASRGRGDG